MFIKPVLTCWLIVFEAESGVKKAKWAILAAVILGSLLLWVQVLNGLCDEDVQFFSGVCTINKFIPW